MDDIKLSNADKILFPPDEVKVVEFTSNDYPEGKRIRLRIKFTPFHEVPSAEKLINNEEGNKLSTTRIIETIDTSTEITVHLPGKVDKEVYSAS